MQLAFWTSTMMQWCPKERRKEENAVQESKRTSHKALSQHQTEETLMTMKGWTSFLKSHYRCITGNLGGNESPNRQMRKNPQKKSARTRMRVRRTNKHHPASVARNGYNKITKLNQQLMMSFHMTKFTPLTTSSPIVTTPYQEHMKYSSHGMDMTQRTIARNRLV